jgi:hypothetical protein
LCSGFVVLLSFEVQKVFHKLARSRLIDVQFPRVDNLYRLTDETVAGVADPGQNGTIGYTLDKVGNRSNRTSSVASVPSVLNQTYNARDWLGSDTYTANGSTAVGQVSDLTLRGTETYDFEEHLILRTKPDGTGINIIYGLCG